MTAPEGTRTTVPPEGSRPTVSRPRPMVTACDLLRDRLNEIDGDLAETETRIRLLLHEKATIEATLRVAGG